MSTDLQVLAVDGAELWVDDIDSSVRFFQGFGLVAAHSLPPAGEGGRSMLLECGDVKLRFRQGLDPTSEVSRHVARHGDTVRDVPFLCHDPAQLAARAASEGLVVGESGGLPYVQLLQVPTVRHTLRRAVTRAGMAPSHALPTVDHVTYCLPFGSVDGAAAQYCRVFSFHTLADSGYGNVGDGATGMRSVVVRSGRATITLTEPASDDGTGQTQRFLRTHDGPGVQHLALAYADLMGAIDHASARGIRFVPVREADLRAGRDRLQRDDLPWDELVARGILVDADDGGLLLQVFTTPFTSRGTLFVEMLQRRGAQGFGVNNFRALFNAVEDLSAR